jgi:hypothetical protein
LNCIGVAQNSKETKQIWNESGIGPKANLMVTESASLFFGQFIHWPVCEKGRLRRTRAVYPYPLSRQKTGVFKVDLSPSVKTVGTEASRRAVAISSSHLPQDKIHIQDRHCPITV